MAVRRWATVIAASLFVLIALPICWAQPAQSGQPAQSAQQNKSSTQNLPSAPLPQPGAGQTKPESQKPAPPPPSPPPSSPPGPYGPGGPGAVDSQPPRSTPPGTPGASSSTEDKVDISPPANDAATHPNADMDNPDVGEFHPFDPHRAAKDIEVGEFYFKRHNYRAAISRYREALLFKPNDAIATYSLAEALDKAGHRQEAAKNYQAYLKILPYGPKAKDAHKALERLSAQLPKKSKPPATAKAANPGKQ